MKLTTKLAVLGLMGATFAIPAAVQADALKVNLLGWHISIGHNDQCWDWRWRRDHGYSDWEWCRDHPGYRGGDRDDHRDRDRRGRDDRGRRDDRSGDRRDRH